MTRKEEIEQAAEKNTLEKNQGHHYLDWFYGFNNGAQWADEHPKENLVDIDYVCEWLKENTLLRKTFIDETFKQAMKGK